MKLALDSSYKVGLAYEKLSLEVLRRYVFHLKHTGRSGDEGQDFSGYWIISRKAVPIVGQCKCYKKPVGPRDVREFESVLYRRCSRSCAKDGNLHVGVFVSKSWFSVAALKTFQSSQMAMIFMQILKGSTRLEPKDHLASSGMESLANSARITSCCEDSAARDQDVTARTLTEQQQVEDDVGYINDMALNTKAKEVLRGVQVLWKWSTVCGQPQKQLELVLT